MKKTTQHHLLKELFGKGRIDVLFFIEEKVEVGFTDVRNFCLKNKIVGSRGTVNIILRDLTDTKLVERKVMVTRPVRTTYQLTQLGRQVVDHLKTVKELLEEA